MTYPPRPWSLADLYPALDAPELEAAFDQGEEQLASFEGVLGKLTPEIDAQQFLEVVRVSERTARIVYRLNGSTNLSFAADAQDLSAQALVEELEKLH